MSCLDVMYHHQSYGAHHYLPATSSSPSSAAAAAAYKAAYYHHHHHHHHHHQQQQQQQQKKFGMYNRLQDSGDFTPQFGGKKPRSEPEEEQDPEEDQRCKDTQPAETEYLSARCVLFTYFRGAIGDVVDEHFSRALSQPSTFSKMSRTLSAGPWKESESQSPSLPSSLWSSSYPSPSSSCVPPSHPDFPHSAAFHADPALWSSSSLAPPTSVLPDTWHYSLGGQTGPGYPHVHEMYSHMHPRLPHAHHMLHNSHSPALDPRFSPLLLPALRASCTPPSCGDAVKTELEAGGAPGSSWPASFHGTVDVYETASIEIKTGECSAAQCSVNDNTASHSRPGQSEGQCLVLRLDTSVSQSRHWILPDEDFIQGASVWKTALRKTCVFVKHTTPSGFVPSVRALGQNSNSGRLSSSSQKGFEKHICLVLYTKEVVSSWWMR
ncbi:hypothetical protein DNTS_030958 [Danionella cerebrum]|uniref:Transcription cofactor vestigial-like protein 3 n=1 Tax=Danionella cerebrum TaxID=2873325 RepID=A0A553MXT1_9TELE|nr:hypothetical protein DNTS_030958 [Danionella translucida]